MDEIDHKILNLLQADAKLTTKFISLKLNLSATAIYERIKKLERDGIIQGYYAILNKKKVKRGFILWKKQKQPYLRALNSPLISVNSR